MNIVYFTHSLQSCWNHGNAHFVRGVLRELLVRGHQVAALEPHDAWSRRNLLNDHGEAAVEAWRRVYPEIESRRFSRLEQVEAAVDSADVVIVHEWNDPALVSALGKLRAKQSRFILLFHDTHHRAVSDPAGIQAFDLSAYDGVLAFGEALAEVYRCRGWGRRVFVWHEAADIRLFRPPEKEGRRAGLVWIGNWGDGERSQELETYLLRPAKAANLPLDVYGVRYPPEATDTLARHGARYRGWLPNVSAPDVFANHLATVHVPRRFYAEHLPGIPTIRVFEALACGIPLITAPWDDNENLFFVGRDFLLARSGDEMVQHLRKIQEDESLRRSLITNGLATIRARHTCAHRAQELVTLIRALQRAAPAAIQREVA